MDNICVFESSGVIEALGMVKSAMGPDAVILDTKKVRGFMGLGKEKIRITAMKKQNEHSLEKISEQIRQIRNSLDELKKIEAKETEKRFIPGVSEKFIGIAGDILSGGGKAEDFFEKYVREDFFFPEIGICFFSGRRGAGKTSFILAMAEKMLAENRKFCLGVLDYCGENDFFKIKKFAKERDITFLGSDNAEDFYKKAGKYEKDMPVLAELRIKNENGFENEACEIMENEKVNFFLCHKAGLNKSVEETLSFYGLFSPGAAVLTHYDEAPSLFSALETVFCLKMPLMGLTLMRAGEIAIEANPKKTLHGDFKNALLKKPEGLPAFCR